MTNIPESVAFERYRTNEFLRYFRDTANSVKDAIRTQNGEGANREVISLKKAHQKLEALGIQVRPSKGGLFKPQVESSKKPEKVVNRKPGFTKE